MQHLLQKDEELWRMVYWVCTRLPLVPKKELRPSKIRAGDKSHVYNALLLLLRKVNMDIQFMAEISLALAHCVTGYATIYNLRTSNMQDPWQEVSSTEQYLYSRPWGFDIMNRTHSSVSVGCSDIVLDHRLCGKSGMAKWIDAALPHRRKRPLNDRSNQEDMPTHDSTCNWYLWKEWSKRSFHNSQEGGVCMTDVDMNMASAAISAMPPQLLALWSPTRAIRGRLEYLLSNFASLVFWEAKVHCWVKVKLCRILSTVLN